MIQGISRQITSSWNTSALRAVEMVGDTAVLNAAVGTYTVMFVHTATPLHLHKCWTVQALLPSHYENVFLSSFTFYLTSHGAPGSPHYMLTVSTHFCWPCHVINDWSLGSHC